MIRASHTSFYLMPSGETHAIDGRAPVTHVIVRRLRKPKPEPQLFREGAKLRHPANQLIYPTYEEWIAYLQEKSVRWEFYSKHTSAEQAAKAPQPYAYHYEYVIIPTVYYGKS